MTAYLTIDDAPSADLPQKLEILREHGVPALFFCEGRRLADHAGHARQAVEAGYHLGNHAYSHSHASDLTVGGFREEVARTESLLEDVYDSASVERPARVFRFPYGDKGGDRAERFQEVLDERGFVPPNSDGITYDWYDEHADDRDWYWTVDVEDWTAETEADLREQFEAVTDRLASESDDIILFHDAVNTPALFEAFVELLVEHDVELADPIDLVR